eukprot:gene32190-41728_t
MFGFSALESATKKDPSDSYSLFDRFLFQRFADSVVATLTSRSEAPILSTAVDRTFENLISDINQLTFRRPPTEVHDVSKRILVGLFPQWLLPAYKRLFGGVPGFSAAMNAWVTHWTTTWLMGPSTVVPLDGDRYGANATGTGLLVEKCLFLEQSGCIQTCTHACKVPTQRFFLEEMGLPVSVRPNLTDYSCRFDFGVFPLPLSADPTLQEIPCLSSCPQSSGTPSRSASCLSESDFDAPSVTSTTRKSFPASISTEIALLESTLTGGGRPLVPGWQLQRSFERLQQLIEHDDSKRWVKDFASIDRLRGRWDLIYSSSLPGGYFEFLKEVCEFTSGADGRTFILDSWLPNLTWFPKLRAQGSSSVLSENPAAVSFAVQKMLVGIEVPERGAQNPLFTIALGQRSPRTYQFLYIGDAIAVAKSSSGGWSLLHRTKL